LCGMNHPAGELLLDPLGFLEQLVAFGERPADHPRQRIASSQVWLRGFAPCRIAD